MDLLISSYSSNVAGSRHVTMAMGSITIRHAYICMYSRRDNVVENEATSILGGS